jgi:hypothetical protein
MILLNTKFVSIFLDLLSRKTQAILNMAVLIRVVVGKQRSANGQVRIQS